jgi:uncharacterized Zn-finger protein
MGRDILYSGRFDVEKILDVRGGPDSRFYLVEWAPGQLGDDVTWEHERNLGDHCAGVIQDWFLDHPAWYLQDVVEQEGEIRCTRCNKLDFNTTETLQSHYNRLHKTPVITGTLAYKKAQTKIKEQMHQDLENITVGNSV